MMSTEDWNVFRPKADDVGRRVDRVLRKMLPESSLSRIYGGLRKGRIRVNGRKAGPGYRLQGSDLIQIAPELAVEAAPGGFGPADAAAPPTPGTADAARTANAGKSSRGADAQGEPGVILETEGVVAFNKPKGLLTHGRDSLESYALGYLARRIQSSLSFTPGPMHRLDRNTSGLVLFPRSRAAAERFSELLRERRVSKEYVALLEGKLTGKARWHDFLYRDRSGGVTYVTSHRAPPGPAGAGHDSGRRDNAKAYRRAEEAVTDVEGIAVTGIGGAMYTLVRCFILTGRTHQIRAQAGARGLPLAGDTKYGGGRRKGGYLLHAAAITLETDDPVLGFREVRCPPPGPVREELQSLFGPEALPWA